MEQALVKKKIKSKKRMIVRVEYLKPDGKVFDSWDVCEVKKYVSATDLRKMREGGRMFFEV